MSRNAKRFRVDVLSGTFGTIAAYIIGILFLPLITHFYRPEHIGSWQILLSIISLTTPLATFQFENAIVLENSKQVIARLLSVVVINTIAICSVLGVVTLYLGSRLNDLISLNIAINTGWLIIAGTIIQASFLVLTGLIVREKKFKAQAMAKVLGALMIPLLAIPALLFFDVSKTVYIVAALAGVFAQVLYLYVHADRRCFPRINDWSIEKTIGTIKKYRVYPKYMVPYALSQGAVWQVTLMSFGVLFSTSMVGAYTVARQLVYMPVSLLTAGLKQVVFSYASSASKYDRLVNNRIEKLLINIVNLAIPFAVFGFTYLPATINYVLGDGWEKVGVFSRWILISAVSLMLTSWLDRLFDVYGKQGLAVLLQISSDALFLLVLLVCYLLNVGALSAVISLSLFLAIYNLAWLFIVLDILRFSPSFWVALLIRVLIITIASVIMMRALEVLLPLSLALPIELLSLGIFTYSTYLKLRINT